MTPSRDEATLLLDEKMNDQSRFFYCLPEIRFRYRGWKFAVHDHPAEYRFFVSDRACPDAILAQAASRCARPGRAKRSAAR